MTVALTPKFAAMNGRDKWETLVLSGLIGTDEPWIAATTATLREEAAERQSLSDRIDVLSKLAGDVRWQELSEGAQFTIIDRIMLRDLYAAGQASFTQGGKANG